MKYTFDKRSKINRQFTKASKLARDNFIGGKGPNERLEFTKHT